MDRSGQETFGLCFMGLGAIIIVIMLWVWAIFGMGPHTGLAGVLTAGMIFVSGFCAWMSA